MCGCSEDAIQVTYRYSTKELETIEKTINDACNEDKTDGKNSTSGVHNSDRIKKKIFK
jgi:hypothetical protein